MVMLLNVTNSRRIENSQSYSVGYKIATGLPAKSIFLPLKRSNFAHTVHVSTTHHCNF